MAFSLNRAQIIGNVTRAPEIRIAGSQKVATFGVATNFTWKDQMGQKKEKAEFHNVVAWRRLAEICEQYLHKGSKVYIEGRIQTHDWEGEDGVKRHRTEIVVDNMIMLDRKGEGGGGVAYGTAGGAASASAEAPTGGTEDAEANREQRSIKNAQKMEETKTETQKPQEEEISIDDLPF